jgi:hypothetical protein
MNKKLNTERQTQRTQNAECDNAVSLRHGLGTFVYFVGKYIENKERFEIQGIFSTEKKAISSCQDRTYFVLPIKLNKLYPDKTIRAKEAYYPVV